MPDHGPGRYVEYRHPIRVGPGAIDDLDHVNNAIYLMWMQEAVNAYWRKTAPPEQVETLAWIAHRHDVVYHTPAVLHDLIVAVVRVIGHQGCRAHFETRFERNGEDVAIVESTLVCIDRGSRQIVRIRPDLAQHFYLRDTEATTASGAMR